MLQIFVIIMGAILAICGAIAIWQGYDIIQVERGWASVIAGASAVGAGAITIAIGILIGAVEKLRYFANPERLPVISVAPVASPEHAPIPQPADIARAAGIDLREDLPVVSDPPPAEEREHMTRASETASPPSEPKSPGAWINEAIARESHPPHAAPDIDEPASGFLESPKVVERNVVGRYTIAGVDYVLFESGLIEGQTPDGPVQFQSLAELRAHIDRGTKRPLNQDID